MTDHKYKRVKPSDLSGTMQKALKDLQEVSEFLAQLPDEDEQIDCAARGHQIYALTTEQDPVLHDEDQA